MASRAEGPEAVDAYLATMSPAHRALLQGIREEIRSLVPEATEGISYGIAAFKIRGRAFIWYAGYAKHCSMYPVPRTAEERDALAGYTLGKGTVQFTVDHPLPPGFVARVVRARLAETIAALDATGSARDGTAQRG